MKCRWSHCRHGGEVDRDLAVKEGAAYYHPDCYAEKKAIQGIIDLYHERVDAAPIENYLRKTINDLIFKDGNTAEYLLFAFNYCLNNGWHLHTPSGLRYVAKDGTAKAAWNKKASIKASKEIQQQTKNDTSIESEFDLDATPITSSVTNKNKFSSVLG